MNAGHQYCIMRTCTCIHIFASVYNVGTTTLVLDYPCTCMHKAERERERAYETLNRKREREEKYYVIEVHVHVYFCPLTHCATSSCWLTVYTQYY